MNDRWFSASNYYVLESGSAAERNLCQARCYQAFSDRAKERGVILDTTRATYDWQSGLHHGGHLLFVSASERKANAETRIGNFPG